MLLGSGVLMVRVLMVRVWAFRLCSLPCCRLLGAGGAYRSRFASTVRLVRAFRSFLLGTSLLAASSGCNAITAKHATNVWDFGWASRSSCTGNPVPLRKVYTAEIGVCEITENNDHPRIDEYLRYVGLGPGYAWCAAFVSWVHGQAGYPEPRNAWSPALFPMARRVGNPRQGDVFGIYYNNLRRIGHCGFVDGWGDTNCITVEGNTGPDGAVFEIGDPNHPVRAGPERQGVYRKRRPVRTIHTVARWH